MSEILTFFLSAAEKTKKDKLQAPYYVIDIQTLTNLCMTINVSTLKRERFGTKYDNHLPRKAIQLFFV